MLQGWRPHHQLHGGRLRGHPYRRRYCLQEHCIWRGWKSRAFSLHLRPSGHLWGGTRLTAGMSVWLEADPVHLTATAYKDIASLVQNQAALAGQDKPPPGRRRINSIVPCHQLVAAPLVPQVPGWISGTESRGSSGGFGWAAAAVVLPPASAGTAAEAAATTITPIETSKS